MKATSISTITSQKAFIDINKKKIFYFIALSVFIAIFLLNYCTAFVADDYNYSMSTSFIRTFIDEARFYQIMNGRTLAHIIARNFLRLPKIFFNIANSIMYVYLTFLIYLYANPNHKKETKILLYLFINTCVWLFVPHFGQTVLWETGACNYLWYTSIILSFLLPFYYHTILNFNFKHEYIAIVGMFFAGIIAGWGNENTSGGGILFVFLFFALCKLRKTKIKNWMISGLFGSIIGYLIMMFSPGNRNRMAAFPRTNTLPVELITRFSKITTAIRENMIVLLSLWLILFIVFILVNKNKQKNKFVFPLLFAFVSLATFYALTFTPTAHEWGRSMFGATVFMIIGIAYSFSHISLQEIPLKATAISLVSVLILHSVFLYFYAARDMILIKINSDERDAYVQEQKAAGNMNPIVSVLPQQKSTSYNAHYTMIDILADYTHWMNLGYAAWAKVDTIRSVSNADWEKIYRYGDPTLMNCQTPEEYLKLIHQDKYTLFLSVHSDASLIGEQLTDSLEQLGIKKEWQNLNEISYLAVIDSGRVIYENSAERRLTYETTLDDLHIQLKSKGSYLDDTAMASIVINDFDYARNQEGLNITVYDQEQNKIVDSAVIQYNQKENKLVLRR